MSDAEEVKKVERGDVAVYYLEQDIEVFRAEAMRDFLLRDIDAGGYHKIIFNFEDVRFVDSTGIGLFVNLQFSFKSGVTFRFCHMRDNIRNVFEYTNLLSYFNIDVTEEHSLAAFSEGEKDS